MQNSIIIPIQVLPGAEDLPLPRYQTDGAAAMDLHAAVCGACEILPGATCILPCGFSVAIPPGYEGQIRPRSGLVAAHSVTVANSPGTIDADYRGEIKVILMNVGDIPFVVTRGMRIAQLVVAPVSRAVWQPVSTLPNSDRGQGGFGHTGLE